MRQYHGQQARGFCKCRDSENRAGREWQTKTLRTGATTMPLGLNLAEPDVSPCCVGETNRLQVLCTGWADPCVLAGLEQSTD